MTKAYKDGMYLMMLGAAVFLSLGMALEAAAPVSTADFRLVYYGARCLIEHHDPYQEQALRKVYQNDGGESPNDTPMIRKTETQLIYFPSVFPVTVPLALLPFGPAHFLWLFLTAASLTLSSFLLWSVGAEYAPVLCGCLIGFALANCELFLAIAGPGGIAIGFCMIAAWCFVRERFVFLGVGCLAVSLMLKPHDSGLVWLYFLFAGKTFRRRALQTLLLLVLLTAPAVLWLGQVAPGWAGELAANLAANSAHGGLSDPGISSSAGHGIAMIISLQTIFSFFHDDPRFYNPASYVVCGVLLAFWLARVVRSKCPEKTAWFALAPIGALSMLPVYHRLDDAKLLLLAVPVSAMLWRQGGARARAGLLAVAGGIVSTAAIVWAVFFALFKLVRVPDAAWAHNLAIVVQVFPPPLALLGAGVFFLWIFCAQSDDQLATLAAPTAAAKE